jgi:NAD(P)-dependent dehydrogenase (short-subunit alcohol dehydrogenase family)
MVDGQAHSRFLSTFDDALNVAIIGASGGIGAALTNVICRENPRARVHAFSRRQLTSIPDNAISSTIELENESSIAGAATRVFRQTGALDMVFVATGLLHDGEDIEPEKSWRSLNARSLEKIIRVNTVGPALVAKHFLSLMKRDAKSVFACLSARVGSIEDNRLGGWYAYRASKAALNMIIKTLSIELSRSNSRAICVGLHPGTVNTSLSKPFQGNVRPGKLLQPENASMTLLTVVDNLTTADSGKIFSWDGSVIPP